MARTVDLKPGYSATARRMEIPANYYALAEEYLDAAIILYEAPPAAPTGRVMRVWTGLPSPPPEKGTRAPLAMFFCFAQSAELFIKAFLSAKGVKKCAGWNKHDLIQLLQASSEVGLNLNKPAHEVIADIGLQNRGYALRFQKNTTPIVLPPANQAIASIQHLRDNVLETARPFMKVRGVPRSA